MVDFTPFAEGQKKCHINIFFTVKIAGSVYSAAMTAKETDSVIKGMVAGLAGLKWPTETSALVTAMVLFGKAFGDESR